MAEKNLAKERARAEKSERLRSKIQKTIEHQKEVQKRELLRRRLDLATTGVTLYRQGKIADAARNWHQYIKILEEWKRVPEGGLKPDHFDRKKEMPELLLISAIYWDLAKLYDKTRTAGKYREFTHCLDKYVQFSKGMPYQPLSCEAVRKYIRNDKPLHRKEFRNTFLSLGGDDRCFVATALSDELEPGTIQRLRCYRDERLARSALGRALIRAYYAVGPAVSVRLLDAPSPLRGALARALDRLSLRLS